MKKLKYFALALSVLLTLTDCSDDDPVSANEDLGIVEFTITGDIEGNLEGIAEFDLIDESSIVNWELSFTDIGPQTFSLLLITQSQDEIERPAPGVYEIGQNPNTEGEFMAIFNDLEDGITDSDEYSTLFGETGGELEITESESDIIRGSFSFTAVKLDQETNEIAGEIFVENGEFTAFPKE